MDLISNRRCQMRIKHCGRASTQRMSTRQVGRRFCRLEDFDLGLQYPGPDLGVHEQSIPLGVLGATGDSNMAQGNDMFSRLSRRGSPGSPTAPGRDQGLNIDWVSLTQQVRHCRVLETTSNALAC